MQHCFAIGLSILSIAMAATAVASLAFAVNGLGADESHLGRISATYSFSLNTITVLAQLHALVTVPAGFVCAALLRSGPPPRRRDRRLVSLLAGLTFATCAVAALGTALIALLNSIQIDGCAGNGCPEMGIAQRAGITVGVASLVTGMMAALILVWSGFRSPTLDGGPAMPTSSRVAGDVAATLPAETQRVIREFASREVSLAPSARAEVARAIAARVRPLIPESAAHPDDLEFVRGIAAALPDARSTEAP